MRVVLVTVRQTPTWLRRQQQLQRRRRRECRRTRVGQVEAMARPAVEVA